jgi:hypothetical protein
LEKHVETLLWREFFIELAVGVFGFLETPEFGNRLLHVGIVSFRPTKSELNSRALGRVAGGACR